MNNEIKIGFFGVPLKKFYQNGILNEYELRKWIVKLANAGMNCIRINPIDIWNGVNTIADVFSPYLLVGDRFDLNQWNPEYFKVWKRVFQICNEYAVTPVLEFTDNCQINGPWKVNSPWYTNLQNIYSFYGPEAYGYVKLWMQKCFAEFGFTIGYGECNEGTPNIVGLVDNVINPTFKEQWVGDFKPAPFCYGACAEPGNTHSTLDILKGKASIAFGDDISLKIYRPSHGCKNVTDPHFTWPIDMWGQTHPIATGWSDDGVMDGDSLCDWTTYNGRTQTRPSAEAWKEMVKFAVTDKWNDLLLWFEHSAKNQDDWGCQVNTFVAISSAIFEVNGYWPMNWNRWPEPTPPECTIGQTKTITCWDGSVIITDTCEDGKWKPTGATCPEEPTDCKCIYYLNIHDSWLGIPNYIKCVLKKIPPYCKH
jgi:hypothetical protein